MHLFTLKNNNTNNVYPVQIIYRKYAFKIL